MAIGHFDFHGISKSKGNNIIASSSYMSRKRMKDETETDLGKKYKKSYSTTKDHYLTMMMLPSGEPLEYNDPERCWNDLNKIEQDRLAVRFLLPLPRELTKEQGIELAKEWAYQEFVSKGSVVQLSFHLEKDNNNNFHCHGLGSYRQLVNGKWAEVKSRKLYIDENGEPLEKVDTPKLKNGQLQYNKDGSIKFVKGWQRLEYDKTGQPLLHEDGTPVLKDIRIPELNPDGTQATTKNGKYRKLAWKERKLQFTDLERKTASYEARMLWQDVQNEYYRKHNIKDEKGNILQVDLRSYAEQDKDKPEEERRIPTKHQGIGPAAELIKEENRKEMQRRKDIVNRKKLVQKIDSNIKVITDYVEQELKPEEMFVSDYMQPIREAISLKNEIADEAHGILLNGYETTGEEIRNLQKKKTLSDREQARLRLLQDNKTSWEKSVHKINTIRNYNGTVNLESHCRKTWRGLTGWKRYGYVKNRNKRQAEIYKSYLIHKGQIDPTEQNPDLSLPEKVTLNQALYSVIKGNSVPGMKASYDNKLSAQQNTRNTAAVTFAKWKDNVTSDLHTPPATSDFEIMTVIQTVPERVTQLATNSKRIYYSAVPHDYSMEQDHQRYLTRIMQIEQAEADRRAAELERIRKEEADRRAAEEKRKAEEARKEAERLAEEQRRKAEADRRAAELERIRKEEADRRAAASWSREEYDRLSAIRTEKLERFRLAAMQHIADTEYQDQLERYEDYTQEKALVDKAYNRWKDYEESEQKAKSEYESRNSFFSLHEYTYNIDYAEINRLKRKYEDANNELEQQFPTVPPKPDKVAIIREIKQKFGKRQANLLIKDTADMKFKDKDILLAEYKAAAEEASAYWKKKPTDPNDPNDGKNIQQTQKNDNAATLVPPDRKRSKGKGMNM